MPILSSIKETPPKNMSTTSAQKTPKIAVIGAGYWGKFLIKNFHELGGLGWIVDNRADILAQLTQTYPEVQGVATLDALLALPEKPDGVVLATPSLTHYTLGKQLLEAGIPLYVEKPLATTLADAQALVNLAATNQVPLMVGHLLLYHPAINRIKSLIDEGVLGKIRYIQSDRLNYNAGRADRNVLWDLSPHDFSVLFYLTNQQPVVAMKATGYQLLGTDSKRDHVQVQFTFEDGTLGYTQASWVYPKKQVQLLVVGTEGSVVLDETQPLENRLTFVKTTQLGMRETTPVAYLPLEPLRLECLHWLNCLGGQQVSQSQGKTNGLLVVRWLEAVQNALDVETTAH
jgi:UDP-2-acetamido-3-amino-2,3-dideoxy-glucuronate N-acetyltransferase